MHHANMGHDLRLFRKQLISWPKKQITYSNMSVFCSNNDLNKNYKKNAFIQIVIWDVLDEKNKYTISLIELNLKYLSCLVIKK